MLGYTWRGKKSEYRTRKEGWHTNDSFASDMLVEIGRRERDQAEKLNPRPYFTFLDNKCTYGNKTHFKYELMTPAVFLGQDF